VLKKTMPIYEYTCHKCGETIEAIQKMSDPDLKRHDGCGGSLTKLLSVPTVQFKGGGPEGPEMRHPSVMQQHENQVKRSEKQKKAKPIISTRKG
jgi:putative FmdB family regulatory protein